MKNNSELLNNLGNFINRGLSFVVKFYDQKVPSAEINGNMRAWVAEVNVLLKEYIECMESNQQREGLRRVLAISKLGNKLIQTWQPWVKVKSKVAFFKRKNCLKSCLRIQRCATKPQHA